MKRPWLAHAIVLWLLAPALLWLSSYRPAGAETGRATRIPDALAGFVRVEDYALDASTVAMLGTEDASWRRYERGDESVFVVSVFHDANWKSVHAPDTCLRGSNMDIVDSDVIHTRGIDGASDGEIGRLRMHAVDRQQDYLSVFVFLAAPDFATGDYWSFFWHHAPGALLRKNVSGALIRVETWIGDDGLQAAEARCTNVIQAVIPAAFEQLR
jgi:EpsI family protein